MESKICLLESWDDCKLTRAYRAGRDLPECVETYSVGADSAYIKEFTYETVIAFDATDKLREWILNAITKRGGDFNAHLGFDGVAEDFFDQMVISLDIEKPIEIKGHSRGGAVAVLVGARLSELGFDVHVTTFGAPKFGGKICECKIKATGVRVTRVEIKGDPVCKLPWSIWRKWTRFSTEELIIEYDYVKGVVKHGMYGEAILSADIK